MINGFRGEYWITPDQIIYCDGDAGHEVPDHNMAVVAYAVSEIDRIVSETPALQFMNGFWDFDEDSYPDRIAIVDNLLQSCDEWFSNGTIDRGVYDDIYQFMVDNGVDRRLIDVVGGSVDFKLLAIREWGWIRLDSSRHIELWSLNKTTCERLYDGLVEIEEDHLEDIDNHPFVIEQRCDGKMFYDVPHAFMGSVSEIRNCQLAS